MDRINKLLARMVWKIACTDTRPLEITVAVQSILWGFLLVLPLDTFGTSKVYSVMSIITTEEIWGAVALLFGMTQLILVHVNNNDLRGYISIVALLFWGFIDTAFWLSGSPSTGAPVYLVTCLILMWSIVSLYVPKGKCS